MSVSSEGVCVYWGTGLTCSPWKDVLIPIAAIVVVCAVALAPLVVDSRRTPSASQAASRANRHATLASLVGVVLLVAVLAVLAGMVSLAPFEWGHGRVLAVLPAIAGGCLVVAQAVGQVTWPRPKGSRREAELTRRRVSDIAPARQRRLLVGWSVATLCWSVIFSVLADGPRSITRGDTDPGIVPPYATEHSPYPGIHYSVPIVVAVLVLVLATEVTLRLVTLRPAVTGVTPEWDLHLRRRSARHLVRGVQLTLAVTLASILLMAGWGHLALGQHLVGIALLTVSLLVALTGLAATIFPLGSRMPSDVLVDQELAR